MGDKELKKIHIDLLNLHPMEIDRQLEEMTKKGRYFTYFYPIRQSWTKNKFLDAMIFLLKYIPFRLFFFILRPIMIRQATINDTFCQSLNILKANQEKYYDNQLLLKVYFDNNLKDIDEFFVEKNIEISELKLFNRLLKDEKFGQKD